MSYVVFSNIYIPLLFLTAGISIYRWRILGKADKWMCILLITTLIQELLSRKLAFKGNNFIMFHIYAPIELFLISLYFDRSIRFKKPYVVGIVVGISGIILSVINIRYFQSYTQINSYILLLESCIILSFCMLSFYRLLIREDIVPVKMAHFWLTICFLFYCSLTFAVMGLYGALVGHYGTLAKIFDLTLYIANLLLYSSIAFVFIHYKKLIPSGE